MTFWFFLHRELSLRSSSTLNHFSRISEQEKKCSFCEKKNSCIEWKKERICVEWKKKHLHWVKKKSICILKVFPAKSSCSHLEGFVAQFWRACAFRTNEQKFSVFFFVEMIGVEESRRLSSRWRKNQKVIYVTELINGGSVESVETFFL